MKKNLGRNPYAFILDFDHNPVHLLVIRSREGESPPDIREGLTGILDEIDDDLFKAVKITS
jgi:hypothetical protein